MDQQLDQYYSAIQAQYQANNAWSAEQAQKQMDFQERMSNTAHQREVADLKLAGLNPVLSAGGSGAAAMTGASAERSDANVEALYGLLGKAFDAQLKEAEAMKASAKAVAGAAGAASGGSLQQQVYDSGPEWLADFLYRRTGIKQEHSLPVIRSLWEKGIKTLDKILSFFGGSDSKDTGFSEEDVAGIRDAADSAKDSPDFKGRSGSFGSRSGGMIRSTGYSYYHGTSAKSAFRVGK